MHTSSLLFVTLSALLASAAAQSNQVPPPACLQTCMDKTGNCKMCTAEGKKQVQSCVSSTCSYRDVSYANAYFSSVCSNGGYESYQTNPHTFVKVPDSSCANSTGKASARDVLVEVPFQA